VPALVVLVTSRAPLRVRGDGRVPRPGRWPCRRPRAATPAAVAAARRSRCSSTGPARCRRASRSGPTTPPAVADLCRQLAGIPLALELAAARIRFLNPAALLARLDDAMARAGGPDLPARQRTLKATFDWSYELLDPAEQALLRLLSVFTGGCTLEAVEDVSAALGRPDAVLPLLEVLVEHSLVVVSTDTEGAPRFGLLEPVAQYARSRQDEQEARAARTAHAAVYLALAEQAARSTSAPTRSSGSTARSARTPTSSRRSPGPSRPATPRPPAARLGAVAVLVVARAACSPAGG
jgi:predicted ATPase